MCLSHAQTTHTGYSQVHPPHPTSSSTYYPREGSPGGWGGGIPPIGMLIPLIRAGGKLEALSLLNHVSCSFFGEHKDPVGGRKKLCAWHLVWKPQVNSPPSSEFLDLSLLW